MKIRVVRTLTYTYSDMQRALYDSARWQVPSHGSWSTLTTEPSVHIVSETGVFESIPEIGDSNRDEIETALSVLRLHGVTEKTLVQVESQVWTRDRQGEKIESRAVEPEVQIGETGPKLWKFCGHRGPRVGDEELVCDKIKGHEGKHQSNTSDSPSETW